MTLAQILIFVAFTLLVALLRRGSGRMAVLAQRLSLVRWLLLAGSVLAIYWMQPSMPVRYLDFWLPTATLGLAVLVWAVTREKSVDANSAKVAKDAKKAWRAKVCHCEGKA